MNSITRTPEQTNGDALFAKVILQNDLAGLAPIEKVTHVKNVCLSLGLNPLTKPILLMKFQGKEMMYFSKDATEQLRKINNISITIKETKLVDDMYIVVVEARTPDGRVDSSTAAIAISGLKNENKANAIMKCETKAKRRVTLSICGLGMLDESELDTMIGAKQVNLDEQPKNSVPYKADIEVIESDLREKCLADDKEQIAKADSLDDLEKVFKEKYRFYVGKQDKDALHEIVKAKDARKDVIQKTIEDFQKELTDETV